MTLFERRVIAVKEAMKKAKNSEMKAIWLRKLNQLIANERVAREEDDDSV